MSITQNGVDFLSNAVGLVAVICFAAPALHADRYGQLVSRIVTSQTSSMNRDLEDVRNETLKSLERLRGEWTPWKGHLLLAGTALAGFSYLLGVLKYAA